MTKAELQRLVNEGFELDQQIKPLEKRLGEIKEILAGAANGEACEFSGDGCRAVIGFAARMESRLAAEKEAEAKELSGGFFNKLFCRAPVSDFAKVAQVLLPFEVAMKLARLVQGAPGPRVSFKASSAR